MKNKGNIQFLVYLKKRYQERTISQQEYKTLKGQCLAGDETGAKKGFERLLARKTRASGKVGALS